MMERSLTRFSARVKLDCFCLASGSGFSLIQVCHQEVNVAHKLHTRVLETRIYAGLKGVPLIRDSVHAPSRFTLMRHSLERRELTKRNNQNSLSCWLSTHGSTERLRPAASLRIEDLASEAPNRSN